MVLVGSLACRAGLPGSCPGSDLCPLRRFQKLSIFVPHVYDNSRNTVLEMMAPGYGCTQTPAHCLLISPPTFCQLFLLDYTLYFFIIKADDMSSVTVIEAFLLYLEINSESWIPSTTWNFDCHNVFQYDFVTEPSASRLVHLSTPQFWRHHSEESIPSMCLVKRALLQTPESHHVLAGFIFRLFSMQRPSLFGIFPSLIAFFLSSE